MKLVNGQHLVQLFEQFSPKGFALEGDKIGLQIGTLSKPIRKVMIALDILEEVVDEAIAEKADLIIAHHPLIYQPLKTIDIGTSYGRMVAKLIKHDIAVYAAHTNLDVAKGGVNDLLAKALQLKNTEVLIPTTQIPFKKLAVYVPESDAEKLRAALGNAGAGAIGNYSHCSFTSSGTGSFRPDANSNPHIGELGKQEFVNEAKIEVIFTENIENKVIQAMLKAHPYEEVAYDLYLLANRAEQLGLGRIGFLPTEMTLKEFASHVKNVLSVKGVRAVGNLDAKIKKVAVLGGDGNKYIKQAKMKGADVYVTGDIYYHVAHDAMLDGLNIIDPGHNVEKVMKEGVQYLLANMLEENGYATEVISSNVNTDPFIFL